MNPYRHAAFWLVVLSAVSVGVPPAAADNWPQWRGPHSDGVSTEAPIPATWDVAKNKNLIWKLPLPGIGSSTPAVWGDHIFLTSEDGTDLVLLCAGTDGKERWRKKLNTSQRVGKAMVRGDEGNEASASPSTDGTHVWAFAGSGDLACFDFAGTEVWHVNVQERYGRFNIQFGMHSTPVLYHDRLYLALLHTDGAWVIALDKATGTEVWKIKRESDGQGENLHSYASPVLWQNGTDAALIVHGNDYATAHRLTDGGEIWRVGGLNPKHRNDYRFVASPGVSPDLVVVPSAKSGPVVGVRSDAKGFVGPGSPFELWRRAKDTPDVPTPLIHDGLVYLCREHGELICLDAKTGAEYYNKKNHDTRYRGSPVYADGKIYLTARDGFFTVVAAGKTFKVVGENRMPDTFTASPAISGGRIYLRGWKALYAIGPNGN